MKRKLAVLAAVVALLATGCGKNVDLHEAKAKQVPGTRDLWYFCHQTTLVYFERYNGDDEYEAFFAWGCTPEGELAKGWPENTAEGQSNGEK